MCRRGVIGIHHPLLPAGASWSGRIRVDEIYGTNMCGLPVVAVGSGGGDGVGDWQCLVVLFNSVGGVLSLDGYQGRGLVCFDAANWSAVDSRRRSVRNVVM